MQKLKQDPETWYLSTIPCKFQRYYGDSETMNVTWLENRRAENQTNKSVKTSDQRRMHR